MAYETSFRKHVMKVKKEEGLTYEETAKRFKIDISTLFRWKKKPVYIKRRNKPATKIDMEKLKADVKENPDAYLAERAKRFEVSIHAIWHALRRLNIRYKKKPQAPKSLPRKKEYIL